MNNKKSHRETRQRRLILEALRSVKSHPTAYQLHDMVKKQLPNISLGTVYRNIEHLARTGKIMSLNFAGAQTRYDGTTDDHFHFRCKSCGKVMDVETKRGLSLIKNIKDMIKDCVVENYRLEFSGRCLKCKQTT